MRGDFIEETTTSIAGTSGNGAVTLTSLIGGTAPGTIRYSTVFGTTARLVDYVIEDITQANGTWEEGIGSVASNVLTRTSPRMTWSGTTLVDSGTINPLAFGSTPTTGNIRIRCSPRTASLMPTVPFYVSSIGDDMGLLAPNMPGGSTAFQPAGAVGSQYFYPYYWSGSGQIVQFACAVSTGAASTHIAFALYEVGSNGLPGRLLLNSNSMSTVTSTITVKDTTTGTWGGDVAANPWLPPGWYWLGWAVDSVTGAPTMVGYATKNNAGFAASGPMPGVNRATSSYVGCNVLAQTGQSYGTWNNPQSGTLTLVLPVGSGVGSIVPVLGLKPGQ